jgi:hemolysin III
MRGVLHTYAFGVAVLCGIVLCALATTRPGIAPLVSCAIYSLTVCGLFGTSALYHRRVWSPSGYRLMKRLDHSMIFIFIAGTYTPFSVLLLAPDTARWLLWVVWSGALLGVAMKLVTPHAPRWLSAPLYIALGWVAVAVMPQLLARGGAVGFTLLLVGGAAYTLGAVSYALRRPNPWPGTFGHHELFHACTIIAATAHHIAIYLALYRA